VFLTGAEPEGPKPTAETDLGLFRGYGVAAAVGYRWLPLRLELEYQSNTAYTIDASFFGGGGDDRIAVTALMLNGVLEWQALEWLGLFAGAGLGRARAEFDLSTCYQLSGCPASYGAHTSGSGSARQVGFGVTLGPFRGHQAVIGFRRLKTGSLGLTDNLGQPFAVDRADLKMSFFGWRGNF
jgi:opacity protein-like surface antigen